MVESGEIVVYLRLKFDFSKHIHGQTNMRTLLANELELWILMGFSFVWHGNGARSDDDAWNMNFQRS